MTLDEQDDDSRGAERPPTLIMRREMRTLVVRTIRAHHDLTTTEKSCKASSGPRDEE
jgi:hypothetical protein